MKKLLLLLLVPFSLFAQEYDPDEHPMERRMKTWQLKGFEFYIGGGAAFANNKTADFYDGSSDNIMSLDLLFDNKFLFDEITELITTNYAYTDSVVLGQLPIMRYNPAMSVQVGFKYRFSPNWYFGLNYAFSRFKAVGEFIMDFPDVPPGNQRPNYAVGGLFAKEDRSTIELNVGYIMHFHPIAKPFFEIGAQFNYVSVKSFEAVIEDTPFNLMNEYANPTNPGVQEMPYNNVWGGAGYGFAAAVGVKIAASPTISIDPAFYLSVNSLGHGRLLEGYNQNFVVNYAAMVRITISDAAFFKNY